MTRAPWPGLDLTTRFHKDLDGDTLTADKARIAHLESLLTTFAEPCPVCTWPQVCGVCSNIGWVAKPTDADILLYRFTEPCRLCFGSGEVAFDGTRIISCDRCGGCGLMPKGADYRSSATYPAETRKTGGPA